MIRSSLHRCKAGVASIGIIAIGAFVVLLLGLKTLNTTSPSIVEVASSPDVKHVVGANTGFGFRLLHKLTQKRPEGNVFFSPFSISNALTMTLNGAGGQTRRDMAKTLGLEAMDIARVNHGNGLLLPSLVRPDPQVEVSVANALWANRGVTLAPDFRERCRRFYNAPAESLNFGSPAAVGTINEWVSENTHAKITHLVSHTDIATAAAVLTNAVYFHGKWQTPFDKAATHSAPFILTSGGLKSVPLMRQESTLSYRETPRCQAVSMPYGSGRMSLYVLLPKSGQPLDALAESLDAEGWSGLVTGMKPTRLTLFLPRFQAEYEARLRGPLSSLGMGSAFQAGADFQPMGLGGAFIGDVIHKAVLDVDEEGTVAAAATAVIMKRGFDAPNPVMRVDHPFFCAIRDNPTGTMLFEGIIRDPK